MTHRTTTWRKSSFSVSSQNCVELATAGDTVLMRDSKRPDNGHLTISRQQLTAFVADARAGSLDHLT